MSVHEDLEVIINLEPDQLPCTLIGLRLTDVRRLIAEHRTVRNAAGAAQDSAEKLRRIDVELHAQLIDLIDAIDPILAGTAGPGEWELAEATHARISGIHRPTRSTT
jgi:hypothetical protein